MKIITYNINGIRSVLKKGFQNWLEIVNPDIICLQEIKANLDQFDYKIFQKLGYYNYWFPSKKKGYSGVSILSKLKPLNVNYGMEKEVHDIEGRVIRLDFNDFSVLSVYFPSGTSGEERQIYKFKFLKDFKQYILKLSKKKQNLIISGDFNICHKPIDIHNPEVNKNSSGFLPEERQWITDFLDCGYIDSFRFINKQPNNYSWWSYRANSRKRNKGWRIDYHIVSKSLKSKIQNVILLKDVIHSDHCPILFEFDH